MTIGCIEAVYYRSKVSSLPSRTSLTEVSVSVVVVVLIIVSVSLMQFPAHFHLLDYNVTRLAFPYPGTVFSLLSVYQDERLTSLLLHPILLLSCFYMRLKLAISSCKAKIWQWHAAIKYTWVQFTIGHCVLFPCRNFGISKWLYTGLNHEQVFQLR